MLGMKKNILFILCFIFINCFSFAAEVPAVLLNQMPSHAKTILGFQSPRPQNVDEIYQGPNCFMGVMYWYNPQMPLRFVSMEEIEPWISQNFRRLAVGEKTRLGDVIVFYRKDLGIWNHAAIVLNDELVWNKLGPDRYIFDINTEKLEFIQPEWTASWLSDHQETYEVSDVMYFRLKH